MQPKSEQANQSWILYAGVRVGRRGENSISPLDDKDYPAYDQTLVKTIQNNIQPGDAVVGIGVGLGVTSIVAIKAAGAHASTMFFEKDRSSCLSLLRLAGLNNVVDQALVRCALVSENAAPKYASGIAIVNPINLPQCHVLKLDCEGSELEILRNMSIRPRTIIVKTHGVYGSSTDSIIGVLKGSGYAVEDYGFADPDCADLCANDDLRVLVGNLVR